MALYQVTAPMLEPVSLDEVKAHVRVAVQDDDALLYALIKAARAYVETFTHRALPAQTWDWKLDAFPAGALVLPKPPVTSITSITYLDSTGTSQTWSSSLYRTDLPTDPHGPRARITPAYGQAYPSTYPVTNAVTVRFVSGYSTIPPSLAEAMKVLVRHWYEHPRDAVAMDQGVTPADPLLWPYVVD